MTGLDGFRHLPGYLAPPLQAELASRIGAIVAAAPLYTPTMPRTGKPFSVRMTNCGALGWVSDKSGGYRYQAIHPITGRPWPAMPRMLLDIWADVAGYPAPPEACLVNLYGLGAKMDRTATRTSRTRRHRSSRSRSAMTQSSTSAGCSEQAQSNG